jgi:hypothetical protein
MTKELRYSLLRVCVVFEVSLDIAEENLLLMPQIRSRSLLSTAPSLPTVRGRLCRNSDEEKSEVGKGVEGRDRDLNKSVCRNLPGDTHTSN